MLRHFPSPVFPLSIARRPCYTPARPVSQPLATGVFPMSPFIETFIRGGGPGGQKINKTATTVVLRDPDTGLEVRVCQERSLARNRALARQLLTEKIEELRRAEAAARQAAREKKRRQRRQRSPAQKAVMLEDKRRRSAKKSSRRPPRPED